MDQLNILESLKFEINLREDEKQAWLEGHEDSEQGNICTELFSSTNEENSLVLRVFDGDDSREESEVVISYSDSDNEEGGENLFSDWARFSPNTEFWINNGPLVSPNSKQEIFIEPRESEVLSSEMMSLNLHNLIRLPETSKFAHSKLILPSKGLIDISVLNTFKYLMYIDLSDNKIDNMGPFRQMPYLLYLNLNHNNISVIELPLVSPYFLTYLDLSFNNIEEIPDLTNLWSLKQLDLSNNKIYRISGIYQLRYLKRLNLSYNQIEIINVEVFEMNTVFLDVSHNKIIEMSGDVETLRMSQTLYTLNLSHNCIFELKKLKLLYWLKHLDLSYNNIFDARELNWLNNLKKIESISLVKNPISQMKENRLFLIYLLPSLISINSIIITKIERLNAHNLFSNSLTQQAFQIHSHLMVKRYSPNPTSTYSLDRTKEVTDVNLVILVGPPGSGKWEVIQKICAKSPQYVRMGRLVTSRCVHEHMTVVSLKQFHELFDNGRVVTYDFRLGAGFALCWDELKRTDKIILIGLELSAALCLVWQGLNPHLILTMTEDKQLHLERLKKLRHDNISLTQRILSDRIPTVSAVTLTSEVNLHEDGDSLQKLYPSFHHKLHSSPSSVTNIHKDGKTNTEQEIKKLIENYISQKKSTEYSDIEDILSICYSEKLKEEEELDEYVQNKDFIDTILGSRDEYINIHHNNPGLFISSVKSDDIEHLETRVMNIIHDLLKKSEKKVNNFYNLKEDSLYEYITQKNVNKLLSITKLQFTPNLGSGERCEDNSPNQACFYFNR